jgi:hypothetical protein
MTDKKPYTGNRGGTTEFPEGWSEPETVDLTKRYPDWAEGFTVPKKTDKDRA